MPSCPTPRDDQPLLRALVTEQQAPIARGPGPARDLCSPLSTLGSLRPAHAHPRRADPSHRSAFPQQATALSGSPSGAPPRSARPPALRDSHHSPTASSAALPTGRAELATAPTPPPTLPHPSEAALLSGIAALRTQVQHRLQQVQTLRSDTRSTLDRLQRAQRTFDALVAAPLQFHFPAVVPSSGGPSGAPTVRSPSPRPRNSR